MNYVDIPFFPNSSGSGGGGALPENVATKDDINQLKTQITSSNTDIEILKTEVQNISDTSNKANETAAVVLEKTINLESRVTNVEHNLENKVDKTEEVNFSSNLFDSD